MSASFLIRVALMVALSALGWDCPAAVLITGNAEIDENGTIRVAQETGDGTLTITAPTTLEGGGILVAGPTGSTGSVVVDGGTYESKRSSILIASRGHGQLQIINGGRIVGSEGSSLQAGRSEPGIGEILVSGPNSLLYLPRSQAIIGLSGEGSFTVEAGATATTGRAVIGADVSPGSLGGGSATVRGLGSRWEVRGGLEVGNGTLDIAEGGLLLSSEISLVKGMQILKDGGKVSTSSLLVGTQNSSLPRFNYVLVDGLGSRLSAANLNLNNGSGLSQIVISNGGTLSTSFANVEGGRLIVDGVGSHWEANAAGYTQIGGFTGSAELLIYNGGSVSHRSVELGARGRNPSSAYASVTNNSHW